MAARHRNAMHHRNEILSTDNTTPRSASTSRVRAPKGIGVPTSVWFDNGWEPDLEEQLDREHAGLVLPDWASDRLVEEYLSGDYSLAVSAFAPAPVYGEYGCDQSAHHDVFGDAPVGLAIIEFHEPRTRQEFTERNLNPHRPELAGEYLRSVLSETRNILVRDGILAVALSRPVPGERFTDRTSDVIALARHAGFAYLQHLVVIDARFTEHDSTDPRHPSRAETDSEIPVHTRIHNDVLIFTRKAASK
ncbi:hypothetical protein [Catenulispora rubra]|uniref:hypothetical protein n=1 Tax=Catenulispora rubra TaxID=280293 RepID=UPI00189275B4|nr:hypothetical protein [Catenulispora rubra]